MLIAHTYPNANSDTDHHANGNGNGNTNSNRDAHTKVFTHTASASDATTSPIAQKRLVTDVKWLGTREKLSRVSQLRREAI